MLTLITPPDNITLARNTCLYKLRATNGTGALFAAVGVRSEVDFAALTARFTTGQTLTLVYTEPDGTQETVVFTAATNPALVTDLPSGSTPGYSNSAYWAEVARVVAHHPRISPFFRAVISSTKLQITERSGATGWALVVTNSASFTVTATAAQPDTTPDNYRVVLQVFAEDGYESGAWAEVATLENTPDAEGNMYFDISSILAAHCRDTRLEPMVPVWSNDEPVVADNLRRYQVRFREQSGTPVVYQDWTYDTVKHVIDGGVATAIWAEGNYLLTLSDTNAFLTWMADGRTIAPEEKIYLPWFNYTGSNKSTTLEVIAYDVDTGLPVATVFAAISDFVKPYQTLLIPAWPAVLGITATDRYRYEVRVVDAESDYEGGSPEYLSQTREYYITRDFSRTERYIQYLNGFGVPEMWRCTGEYSKNISVARATAQRSLLPGFSQYASDTVQYLTDYTPSLTYRTGYIRRADAEVLQELLLATSIYDVSENGYVPLRITTNDADVVSSLRDLNAYQFAAQPRLTMGTFSKRAAVAEGTDAWQEPNLSLWLDTLSQPWNLP